jgi:hypothetical protein
MEQGTLTLRINLLMKSVPIGIALLYLEENYLPNILGDRFHRSNSALDVPKAYAFVIFVNVVMRKSSQYVNPLIDGTTTGAQRFPDTCSPA